MQKPSMGRVPVMPNGSLITGTVERVQRAPADMPILELTVARVENVGDLANFCAAEVGETIPIHLRGQVREDWPRPRAHVRLRVEFRGDERGGGYYAHADNMEIIETPEGSTAASDTVEDED